MTTIICEQLRNKQITGLEAIRAISDLTDTSLRPFLEALEARWDGEIEDAKQEAKDAAEDEIEKKEEQHEAALESRYNDGWNACLAEIEEKLPPSK